MNTLVQGEGKLTLLYSHWTDYRTLFLSIALFRTQETRFQRLIVYVIGTDNGVLEATNANPEASMTAELRRCVNEKNDTLGN